MSVYVRRFLFNPGNQVLLNIESVNILDLTPPASITGVGTGTVLLVGEFEDGPYNTITQLGGAGDLQNQFGGFGFQYGNTPANNPCAVQRFADNAVAPEFWNGNGAIQLNGKQFAALTVCRVDTHVGQVQFSPQAYITGAAQFSYSLSPGQILAISLNGGGPTSATFNATAATVTSGAQTFPSGFSGGETLILGYDAAPNFTVTFLNTDTTQAACIARINQYAGFAFAATVTGTTMSLTGRQFGTGGQVRVVGGSSTALTALGLTVANTNGTGNVANIAAVLPTEVATVVQGAVSNTKVEVDQNSALRISNVGSPSTSISVGAATTALGLGFTVGQSNTSSVPTSGGIPAGTVVQNSGGTRVFVTAQSIVFTAQGVLIAGVTQPAGTSTFVVPIRHAVDDGTGLSATAGTITVVPVAPIIGSFSCINLQVITAALTEAAIDAAYLNALNATLDINTVGKVVNIVYAARQSNQVRRALKNNAITASAAGCYGRVACLRTPLGTLKATALSSSSEPGVGAYRDQRVIFCYPQANTFVPPIGQRGITGGAGFTASGNVDVGADGFMASILSQLPPEENPGQLTAFTGGINGLESSPNAQGFTMNDYIAFKAAGIAALRMDSGTAIFQSGVTSVDPTVFPQLAPIARRRMADFIQDSIANLSKAFGKKLNIQARRKALAGEVVNFLEQLLNRNNPAAQRIIGYTFDPTSGNTDTTLGLGMAFYILDVRTASSLDSIVFQTTIGNSVQVQEQLPQAA